MLSVNFQKCTGCGACVQACPKKCISWDEKDFGFNYPLIDVVVCVDCGRCENVCPIDSDLKKPDGQRAYAVVLKDKDTLLKSTSGGMFSALAAYVFEIKGVVYGCSMESGFQVKHIRVSLEKDLEKLRGSKYVQSNTENTFAQAEADLKNGLVVLYTGTPCQIAGLYSYLGKEYDNLITADIVCHGVGSQKYFDKFMDYLKEANKDMTDLKFRSKEYVGWSCGGVVVFRSQTDNIKKIPFYNYKNFYYHYFLNSEIYRESCYSCSYANIARQGDFTLGDFWGVEKLGLDLDTFNGCSLLLVNTQKGSEIFSMIDSVEKKEVSVDMAVKQNEQLRKPSDCKASRAERLNEFNSMTGSEIQKKYLKANKQVRLKGFAKRVMPYSIRRKLRSL